jgi:hypothetical protein
MATFLLFVYRQRLTSYCHFQRLWFLCTLLIPQSLLWAQCFQRGTNYATGDRPNFITVADVNGDGRLDIVSANNYSNNVSVLLGQVDGSMGAATNYPVGAAPSGVKAADINADGRTDIITANIYANTVSVLLGQAEGGFGAPIQYQSNADSGDLSVADLNADGRLDIVTANMYANTVSVLLGQAGGGFETPTLYPVGAQPVSIVATDVNLDGRPDIIATNRVSSTISVLLGQAGGGFASAVNYPVGRDPSSSQVADVNLDGRPDIIAAALSRNDITVLLGQASGGFAAAAYYPVGHYSYFVAVSDLNGDGRPDIVTSNLYESTFSVLPGQAAGGFGAAVTYPGATNFPSQVLIGDVNGDSLPDIISGYTFAPNISVLYGTKTIAITQQPVSSSTVAAGANISVPVSFFGVPSSLQWYNQAGIVSGQTSATLTLNSVTTSQSGSYSLVATTVCNSLTTNAFSLQVLPVDFAITAVKMVHCELIDEARGSYQVQFTPQYAGQNSNPITFAVVNEKAATTEAPPYSLKLYTDNPVITLVANQAGNAEARYAYNWFASCQSGTDPNQQPTTSGIPNQTILVGQAYQLTLTNYFSDPDGQTLTYSATDLPSGLSVSGSLMSGTPSTTGISSVQVTALDPGGLQASTSFQLTVNPAPTTPADFTIVGVSTVSCEVVSTGLRRVTFTPQYSGVTGEPISFSVVNELVATTNPGPYSLDLYTDNPSITLAAKQGSSVATYVYNWLGVCTAPTRVGVAEAGAGLQIKVLGNPVEGKTVDVEIRGVSGQSVQLNLTDLQGRVLHQQRLVEAASLERVSVPIGTGKGLLLLQVNTATERQQVKLLKP